VAVVQVVVEVQEEVAVLVVVVAEAVEVSLWRCTKFKDQLVLDLYSVEHSVLKIKYTHI